MWRTHYESHFAAPDTNTLPNAPDIDETCTISPIELNVQQIDVENALAKCKMNSTPGPDKISQFHLKSAFDADRSFFTQMVYNVINNKDFDPSFCKMDVIPIFKQRSAKKLSTDSVKAFRPVCMASCLFKLCECIFVAKVRTTIEEKLSDFQHAYRKGRGTQTA